MGGKGGGGQSLKVGARVILQPLMFGDVTIVEIEYKIWFGFIVPDRHNAL